METEEAKEKHGFDTWETTHAFNIKCDSNLLTKSSTKIILQVVACKFDM